MIMLKKQKAITLIALVITIIILLILAGISIASLNGENGLIAKVKRAKEETKEAEDYQNEIMGNYEEEIEKYIDRNKYIIGYYEIIGYNEETEKLKVSITIKSDGHIENIIYPSGDALTCNGEKEVELNYEVIDGERNIFIVNVDGKQKEYLIQTKGFTKNNRTTIENEKDLLELSTIVNIGKALENKTIEVSKDIDLKTISYKVDGTVANDKSWTPIGNEANSFKGIFDGKNHNINNIYINSNNRLSRSIWSE